MTEEHFSSKDMVQAIYKYAAGLMKLGLPTPEIQGRLVENGLKKPFAAHVVENLSSMRVQAEKRLMGKKGAAAGTDRAKNAIRICEVSRV